MALTFVAASTARVVPPWWAASRDGVHRVYRPHGSYRAGVALTLSVGLGGLAAARRRHAANPCALRAALKSTKLRGRMEMEELEDGLVSEFETWI